MNPTILTPAVRSLAALVFAAGTLAAAPAARAQAPFPAREVALTHVSGDSPGLATGKYVVVVNLDENRLYFTRDRRVLWSAPVGTGTGLRLEGPDGKWEFSTPTGIFHVQYKELNPDWIAPDWYFVENKLPVPPANDPRRREAGGLGAAAIYIGEGLAIHGTDKPHLLGQRVSHGCIRLSNRDVMRLYHELQVGAEVVIVGEPPQGELPPEVKAVARRPAATPRTTPVRDPFQEHLASLSTDELLGELHQELQDALSGEGDTHWPEMAAELLRRGSRGEDADALRGLLQEVDGVQGHRVGHEYAAFLADAFAQGPVATLRALGALDRTERMRATAAIVDATMTLYPGSVEDQVAPWPSRRVPASTLDDDAQEGWEALRRAEASYRARSGGGTAVAER